MLRRVAESVNFGLAAMMLRLAGSGDVRELLQPTSSNPEERFIYLYALAGGWFLLVPVLGVISGAGVGVVHLIGASGASPWAVRILYFLTAFCLMGGLDAAWRTWLVQLARQRHERNARALDGSAACLMNVARRFDNGALLVQFVVGIASAVTLR